MSPKHKGGIYLFRTRKPRAPLGFPVIGRHNAYVGLTSSYYHRERQHRYGGGVYGAIQKSWADLEPKFYRILPLPNWRWLLHLAETLAIWVLCPVYNVKKQPPWNLRKVSPRKAESQRWARDKLGRLDAVMRLVLRWCIYLSVAGLSLWAYLGSKGAVS